jgi:hypothetical protein
MADWKAFYYNASMRIFWLRYAAPTTIPEQLKIICICRGYHHLVTGRNQVIRDLF